MNNYFVILAAGKGSRFAKKLPKQYHIYKGKELIQHSIEKGLKSKLFKKIIVVTDSIKKISNIGIPKNIKIIKGGKERHLSSLLALKYLQKLKPSNVLIHDAARPDFSIKLLKKIIIKLKNKKAVIPTLFSNDSIKYRIKNGTFNLNKKNSYLTQTPQGFNYRQIYKLAKLNKKIVSDDAELFINNDLDITFIRGEKKNDKITYKEDLFLPKIFFGIGFDIHRLIKNKKLFLGGIKIPFHSGLKGHSDGDVILHAVIDAILGAMNKKDIGTHFPDNISKFKNIRSTKLLKPILNNLHKKNISINNLDINLICEKPKVSKHRNKIVNSLSGLLSLNKNKINLKGKTVEKLGLIGKEKAIACEVIVSIIKYD